MYDWVIVGGGPCGLTLATYLEGKVALIDVNSSLGGCHRVTRVPFDGKEIITEHGPRVYSSAYVNTLDMLGSESFVPYKYQLSDFAGKVPFTLSEYLTIIMNWPTGRTMKQVASQFSPESQEFIRRLCVLVDGEGWDRFTVSKFIAIVNQNGLYQMLQPKKPTDVGIFREWEGHLKSRGVEIYLSTKVTHVMTGVVKTTNKQFMTKNIVLAMPPSQVDLLLHGKVLPATKEIIYEKYISIMYWWKDKFQIKPIWGFPVTKLGIAFIPLSDSYLDEPGTYLSTCVTLPDEYVSPEDTFEQLKDVLGLPYPDFTHVYVHGDDAFAGSGYRGPYVSDGIWEVGTHNGNSHYRFTTFESAVCNAKHFLNRHVRRGVEITDLVIGIVSVLVLLVVISN